MAEKSEHSTAELAVRLLIAVADFIALLYFFDLHVRHGVTLDYWIVLVLVAILGSMLSRDIIRDYLRGGPPGRQ